MQIASFRKLKDNVFRKHLANPTSFTVLQILYSDYTNHPSSLSTQCVQVLLGLCSLKIQDVNYFQNFTLLT
jgi:hypothetical protein